MVREGTILTTVFMIKQWFEKRFGQCEFIDFGNISSTSAIWLVGKVALWNVLRSPSSSSFAMNEDDC